VKSVVSKSANKVYIIQSLDRKLDLEDIANSKGMTMEELFTEMENIVLSGTKLNLDHYVNEMIDEADQDDIFDYFRSAADPSVDTAIINFGKGVYSFEELWIMKIKFISEMAN
jgi:ATP-dependent DNA helicase RecQ